MKTKLMTILSILAFATSTGHAATMNFASDNKSAGDYVSRKDRGLVRQGPAVFESEFFKKEMKRSGLDQTGRKIKGAFKAVAFPDVSGFLKRKDEAYKARHAGNVS